MIYVLVILLSVATPEGVTRVELIEKQPAYRDAIACAEDLGKVDLAYVRKSAGLPDEDFVVSAHLICEERPAV